MESRTPQQVGQGGAGPSGPPSQVEGADPALAAQAWARKARKDARRAQGRDREGSAAELAQAQGLLVALEDDQGA